MVRKINRKNQTKLVEKLRFPNKFSLRHYNLATIKNITFVAKLYELNKETTQHAC